MDNLTSKPLVQRLREAQDCGYFHFELFKEAADEIEHREAYIAQFDLVPKGAADEPSGELRSVAAKIIETCRAVDGHANDVLVSRELMGKLVHAWEHPQPPSAWQPISTAPKGPKLLVAYRNRLGNWRRVLAKYYGFQELESIDPDSEDGYAPEGWYEECEAAEEIMRTDEEPEFWQALPPYPLLPETKPAAPDDPAWYEKLEFAPPADPAPDEKIGSITAPDAGIDVCMAQHGPHCGCSECRPVETDAARRARILDAAAATGNVDHYTAVVQSMIDEDERGPESEGASNG